MEKIILVVMVFFLLSGCVELFAKDLPSCLNPESKEYRAMVIGGTCEECGKTFTFSGYQLDHDKNAACPYCKHEQSLKGACNRYGAAYLPENQKKAK